MADATKPPEKKADSKPDAPKSGGVKLGGLKNWIILGVVGLGGWWLYKKFASGALDNVGADLTKAVKDSKDASAPAPDLKGPLVKKGQAASTRSPICITQQDPKMRYDQITQTTADGYQVFQASVRGHFTRRLLCTGGRKFAEIYPHA